MEDSAINTVTNKLVAMANILLFSTDTSASVLAWIRKVGGIIFVNQDAVALNTFDMTMQGWFQRAAGTLRFIGQAQPSTHQLPDNFLSMMPVSLIDWHGSNEEAQICD